MKNMCTLLLARIRFVLSMHHALNAAYISERPYRVKPFELPFELLWEASRKDLLTNRHPAERSALKAPPV